MTLPACLTSGRNTVDTMSSERLIKNSSGELSFVRERRKALAQLYGGLARTMGQVGKTDLEAPFIALAADAGKQANTKPQTAGEKTGAAPEPIVARGSPGPVTISDFPSQYAVWAFAVDNEMALFGDIIDLASRADGPGERAVLMKAAGDCLDRAARYRIERRIAYHALRVSEEIAQFPDIRRIDALEDFVYVALAIERYFCRLLECHDEVGGGIGAIMTATDKIIAGLEPMAQDTHPSRRLDRPLKRLEKIAGRPVGARPAGADNWARLAVEAGRIFDYYDQVFETAQDPQVMALSQRLSASAIERLRLLRKMRNDALPRDEKGTTGPPRFI